MKDSEAAAIANPGQAGARAVAAFQEPGVTASITTKPREYKFDPVDVAPQRNTPYIPAKYRNRSFDTGNNRTLQQKSEEDGLETVEIILPESLDQSRTDWGVIGLRGKNLKPGDREQMPVCHAMQMVQSGVAVFVLSSSTAQEEKQIAELEAKGYAFATTSRPAREREEFADVIARQRKGKSWMAKLSEP
jgi:hypothetical protein